MFERWTEKGEESLDEVPNLLVVVPGEKREAAFHRALEDALARGDFDDFTAVRLPMFITSEDRLKEQGLLGRVWRRFVPPPKDRPLAGHLLAERLSLVEIPAKKSGPFDLERCLGKKWTDAGAASKLRQQRQPPTFPSGSPPAANAIGPPTNAEPDG